MTSCCALPVDEDEDEESYMFSTLTDGYSAPDAERVSAFPAVADPKSLQLILCVMLCVSSSELDPMNYSRCARLLLVLYVRRHLILDDAVVGQTDTKHESQTVPWTRPRRADADRHGSRHTRTAAAATVIFNIQNSKDNRSVKSLVEMFRSCDMCAFITFMAAFFFIHRVPTEIKKMKFPDFSMTFPECVSNYS